MTTSNKILFFVSSMNSGGAERVAANLANAWVARGDSVSLVITFSGRGECFYPLSKEVQLIYLADLVKKSPNKFITYLFRFIALRKIIRKSNANIVLSFLTNVNIAVLLASIGINCKVIVAEHTYPPLLSLGIILNWLRRQTYPYSKYVIMLTSEGLEWLRKYIPSANGAVIPNPAPFPLTATEPRLFPDAYIIPGRRLLLAVGRFDDGKQFDRLLDSFAVLAAKHPIWDLVILGDGPERHALEKQVLKLRLKDRALLPGRAGNIGDWYTRADLYVMSSRFEGFPNTLAEAMAHGCAAVSYDCDTGPRDIIRHGYDGLLVTPVGDVPALTNALDRLMGDDCERLRMAALAIEVRDRFSLSAVLTQWDKIFQPTEEKP